MGDPDAAEMSRHDENGGYEALRVATIRFAMSDMMAHPPHGFEDVVRQHFRCVAVCVAASFPGQAHLCCACFHPLCVWRHPRVRREHVLATAAAWRADATTTAPELEAAIGDLTKQLETLTPVDPCVSVPPPPALSRKTSS